MIRYHARWVVPVTAPPIEDGTVAVDNGRIAYVGTRHAAPPGEDREFHDSVILPGLVNAHTHLELTFMRGFLEDLSFPDWISKLRRSRNDVLTNENLLDAARFGIVEGIAAGITTYADTCSSGVVLQAMNEAGVRGIMYQEVFGPAASAAEAAMSELRDRIIQLRKQTTDLTSVGVSPHAPYTVSADLYDRVGRFARDESLPLAMHIAESADEAEYVKRGVGPFAEALALRNIETTNISRTPISLLEERGLLGERSLLIHCVDVDDEDISAIARTGSAVAHCPISNAKLGHGIAPAYRMSSAGIRVGIGTDSMASNNRMHILAEARAALLFQRALERRPDTPQYSWALETATLGGARALGINDRVGSLTAGKDADIAVFPLDHPSSPVLDPLASVVFALGGAGASFVAVKGEILVDGGRVLRADPQLPARAREVGAKLRAWELNIFRGQTPLHTDSDAPNR